MFYLHLYLCSSYIVLHQSQEIYISGMQSGTLHYVDITTFESPPATEEITGPTIILSPFAVGVLYITS